jgi:hypothetical protein
MSGCDAATFVHIALATTSSTASATRGPVQAWGTRHMSARCSNWHKVDKHASALQCTCCCHLAPHKPVHRLPCHIRHERSASLQSCTCSMQACEDARRTLDSNATSLPAHQHR